MTWLGPHPQPDPLAGEGDYRAFQLLSLSFAKFKH